MSELDYGVGVHDCANGNLTSDGSNTYLYNARDQLVEILDDGGATSATFEYDAFGRRLSKTIQGETTSYRYDGLNPIEETTDRGTIAILSGLGVDERYARDDLAVRMKRREYFLTDHLGSTVALTDSTGAITTHYQYEAYGETQILSGPPPVGGLIEQGPVGQELGEVSSNPYQYTGRENDFSTGMYYYRARYYSPSMKRFTQEDPLGFVDGPNAYAYVKGNPSTFSDPMGLCAGGKPKCRPGVPGHITAGDPWVPIEDAPQGSVNVRLYLMDECNKRIEKDGFYIQEHLTVAPRDSNQSDWTEMSLGAVVDRHWLGEIGVRPANEIIVNTQKFSIMDKKGNVYHLPTTFRIVVGFRHGFGYQGYYPVVP